MDKFKIIVSIVLGILLAVGLFCLAVCIGSGINGLTFSEQIVEWFGTSKESVEQVAETVAKISLG